MTKLDFVHSELSPCLICPLHSVPQVIPVTVPALEEVLRGCPGQLDHKEAMAGLATQEKRVSLGIQDHQDLTVFKDLL